MSGIQGITKGIEEFKKRKFTEIQTYPLVILKSKNLREIISIDYR